MSAIASDLDTLVKRHSVSGGRLTAWLLTILVGSIAAWSFYAEIDERAVAIGSVVPESRVRFVQHLEGGVVVGLFVKDGDTVKANQPLVQVQLAPSDMNLDELQARMDGLTLQRARLVAESRGLDPVWPNEAGQRRAAILSAEVRSFETRRAQLDASLLVLRQQAEQRRLEIGEFEAQRASLQGEAELAKQKFAIADQLVRNQLVTRVELLEAQRAAQQLDGQLQTIGVSISRAEAGFEESQRKIEETRAAFLRETQAQLAENEFNVARTEQLIAQATRQQYRTTIAAPIDGVVKNLQIRSLGDVIKPAQIILEVVPSTESLVIEAKLNPADRGYVEIGKEAVVKISSYDFLRYGGLIGKVNYISADADLDDKGTPYFRLRIQTDKSYLGTERDPLPIMTGMQASAEIITRKKKIWEYMAKPILRARHEAFHER